MVQPTPTILTLKQDFLTAQTRLLSQPLQPSRAWRRGNEAAQDDDNDQRLSERAVDDALFRLNHTLQQHAKRVYPPQATRHVAEQIEGVYLAVGERRAQGDDDLDGREDDENSWMMQGADYANTEIISSLPPTWESERGATAQPQEAKRYAELVERLQGLAARRDEAQARVRRLRKMRAMLQPFSPEDGAVDDPDSSAVTTGDEGQSFGAAAGGSGVQENLVTRGGEVEMELERMRMLLVRVGDKVARLRDREGSRSSDDDDLFGDGDAMIVDDVEVDERKKVEGLLQGLR